MSRVLAYSEEIALEDALGAKAEHNSTNIHFVWHSDIRLVAELSRTSGFALTHVPGSSVALAFSRIAGQAMSAITTIRIGRDQRKRTRVGGGASSSIAQPFAN